VSILEPKGYPSDLSSVVGDLRALCPLTTFTALNLFERHALAKELQYYYVARLANPSCQSTAENGTADSFVSLCKWFMENSIFRSGMTSTNTRNRPLNRTFEPHGLLGRSRGVEYVITSHLVNQASVGGDRSLLHTHCPFVSTKSG
jgi:hypothetical protein